MGRWIQKFRDLLEEGSARSVILQVYRSYRILKEKAQFTTEEEYLSAAATVVLRNLKYPGDIERLLRNWLREDFFPWRDNPKCDIKDVAGLILWTHLPTDDESATRRRFELIDELFARELRSS